MADVIAENLANAQNAKHSPFAKRLPQARRKPPRQQPVRNVANVRNAIAVVVNVRRVLNVTSQRQPKRRPILWPKQPPSRLKLRRLSLLAQSPRVNCRLPLQSQRQPR